MKKRDKGIRLPNTKVDTLIVIGNGFDRWQNLNTSFSSFHQYYMEHRDQILRKLHIKKHVYESAPNDRGEIIREEWSDVEVVFTDPFYPCELEADFWNSFETALGEIDAERLNLFFGKEKSELRELDQCVKNAKRILTEAFCGWVASIAIGEGEAPDYFFGENCAFISFNYTETLEKRFGINEFDVFHIHGQASDKKSIIFGHNKHPQMPERFFQRLGGRFGGLYHIEKMLYDTDKHCQDNIQTLIMYLALRGVMSEDIKDIYVLGHSMSPVDLEYFIFLMQCSKVNQEEHEEDNTSMQEDDWFNAMEYVIKTVGYGREGSEQTRDAMIRKQQAEQAERNKQFKKEFLKMLGNPSFPEGESIQLYSRKEDAKWHVSFHSERDRKWKEYVMQELGCSNYELIGSIDECLAQWRIQETTIGNDVHTGQHGR